jgi:hypothetical protein
MRQRRYGSSHLLADLARWVPAAELAQLERDTAKVPGQISADAAAMSHAAASSPAARRKTSHALNLCSACYQRPFPQATTKCEDLTPRCHRQGS